MVELKTSIDLIAKEVQELKAPDLMSRRTQKKTPVIPEKPEIVLQPKQSYRESITIQLGKQETPHEITLDSPKDLPTPLQHFIDNAKRTQEEEIAHDDGFELGMANDEEYHLPDDNEEVVIEQVLMSAQKPPVSVYVPKLILNQPPLSENKTFIAPADPAIQDKQPVMQMSRADLDSMKAAPSHLIRGPSELTVIASAPLIVKPHPVTLP